MTRAEPTRPDRTPGLPVWRRLPLRARLTAVFTLLLTLGLVLSGVTAASMLGRSLLAGVDTQLAAVTPSLVGLASGDLPQPGTVEAALPSDYHVVFSDTQGRVLTRWSSRGTTSLPTLPALTLADVRARAGQAFTVPGADGGRWRVLARPLVAVDGQVVGSVAVALPLAGVDATLARMRWALVLIAAGVVALGALAGWWAVRRAMRPLGDIERTAAAFAGGDLARRVPDGPPSTEVGRLAHALNGMLTQLEHAFAARAASEERLRRFVADASHELRTPLATIRGYGELYRIGALEDRAELDRTMGRIEESATRMGTLVGDLLQLARLDEGRPPRREPVDVAVLAADAAADLRALDPTREVRLVPVAGAGTLAGSVVLGDEARLRQVLANLVGNVTQHTPRGTPAELAVGRSGDDVVLEVRDHGPGVPAGHAERVFERFYRLDAARGRDTGGAGLGMAIVAAVVAAHGGTVALLPTDGGGATVRVTLPSGPGEVHAGTSPAAATAQTPHRAAD